MERGAKSLRESTGAVVRALPVTRDESALLEGLRSGESWAKAALYDRYAPHVERILRRILGGDRRDELVDLVHDAFVQALASIERVRDPKALLGWMQAIAAHTAFHAIRARRARRWLTFWRPESLPERSADPCDHEAAEAYRRTYAILDNMPADERVAFALRHIDGMELTEVASACDVSLATIKRRLAKADERFAAAASKDEALAVWLEEGGRWT